MRDTICAVTDKADREQLKEQYLTKQIDGKKISIIMAYKHKYFWSIYETDFNYT